MNTRMLLGYAAPYWRDLTSCAMLMVIESVVALATAWLAGRLAGGVLGHDLLDSAVVPVGLLILIAIQGLLRFATVYLESRTSERILADLQVRIYDHLQSLPLGFFQQRRHGDVLSLITSEAWHLESFIAGTLTSILPTLVTIAGAAFLMVRIDPWLGVGLLTLLPVFFLILKIVGRRLRPLARELQQGHATTHAIVDANLAMLPAIKAFTRESLESDRFESHVRRVMKLSTTQQRIVAAVEPSIQFAASAIVVTILWLAHPKVDGGQITPANLVSFLLFAAMLTRPVSALGSIYGQFRMAGGALERLQSVLTESPESIRQATRSLPPLRGDIEFRDITFAYPGRPRTLDGISFRIRAGETVAITGPNGAGKSTIAHLLMRLYEPASGRILIDGIDIATVGLHSLRSQIGIVPQHVLLTHGTVRDNIVYGQVDASDEMIRRAAADAQADGFISQLPDAYDTMIGDQGISLSGGQRQRLALARALLKDPAILILDEATSMFDPAGEEAFVRESRQGLARRTVIIITHRPASLSLADRVIRVEAGAAQ